MPAPIEIHLQDNGLCRIIEGPARRVLYSTKQGVGLALLGLTEHAQTTEIQWVDFLRTHGVAAGIAHDTTVALLIVPAKHRVIRYRRSSDESTETVEVSLNTPTLLIAAKMRHTRMLRSQLLLIAPGYEHKVTTTLADPCLAAWPYGNVYAHGGICWGRDGVDQQVTHPSEIEEIFFQSGFNGDLWYPGEWGRRSEDLPFLLDSLGPDEALPPPLRYRKTVADTIEFLQRDEG
jgi:hypothetical protein